MTDNQERIVCAACLCEGGEVVLGARHWDPVMHRVRKATGWQPVYSEDSQGFWTNKHRYVTRKEAWIIAGAAGQLQPQAPTGEFGTLYSEDVW